MEDVGSKLTKGAMLGLLLGRLDCSALSVGTADLVGMEDGLLVSDGPRLCEGALLGSPLGKAEGDKLDVGGADVEGIADGSRDVDG